MTVTGREGELGDQGWQPFSTSAASADPFASLPPIPPPSMAGAGGPPPVTGFADAASRPLPEWVSARAPQPPLPPPPLPPPSPELLDPLRPGWPRPGIILPEAAAVVDGARADAEPLAAAVVPPAPAETSPVAPLTWSEPFAPAQGPAVSPFVPAGRRPEPEDLVVSSGLRGVIPVAVGVVVLAAIALGSLVLSEDDSSGSIAAADRPAAQTSDKVVPDPDPSTTTRPVPTQPSTTSVAPDTTVGTVAPVVSDVTSPPTTLRSVPAIPARSIPFSVAPRVFVAPSSPTTSAPPVTTPATVWPAASAVPFTTADGSLSVTMPGTPTVVASGTGSGVSEYSVGLAGGVTLVVGRDSNPVDSSLSADQLMPFYAQQVATSVGSTAWLGDPADLYGGRILDSAVLFDGGVLRSRIAIVKGHRYWVTLVVPAASVASTQAMTAFQQALDTLVITDAVVVAPPTTTTPPTTEAPVTTTTEVVTTTTTLP